MLKLFSAFFLVLVLLSGIWAQTQEVERTGGFARLAAMGGNPYVIDPYFITFNPSWASVYSNFIWGDLGSTGTPFQNDGVGQFVAVNFGVNDNLVLGGLLSRGDFNGTSIASLRPVNALINQLNPAINGVSIPAIGNNLELFGAFSISKLSVGFGVSYAGSKQERNPASGGSTEGSASQIGFNAGILTRTSLLSLSGGVSVLLPSASFKPPTGAESKLSQTILLADARLFFKLSDKVQFVPTVNFVNATGTRDIGAGNTTSSSDLPSITVLLIGAGLNYRVGDFLLAGGPAFATLSQTTPAVTNVSPETSMSATLFPIWNLGFEWDIASWLTGRLGYTAVSGSTSIETAENATQVTELITSIFGPGGANINNPTAGGSGGMATVGVGFHLDNFSLDAVVNDDVLRQGLNNIGGGQATFAYLSMSYAF